VDFLMEGEPVVSRTEVLQEPLEKKRRNGTKYIEGFLVSR
jgi:hypothetical protein